MASEFDKSYLTTSDGKPLLVYHASCATFEYFNLDYMISAGCHFGCPEQANYCATDHKTGAVLAEARIFPVYLKITNLVELTGDPGWQWPNQTLLVLVQSRIFTADELAAAGMPTCQSPFEAHKLDCEMVDGKSGAEVIAQCRAFNRKIEQLLREKQIDGFAYDNLNEPRDGKRRRAYLVLNPSQIFSAITGKCLGQCE